MSSSPPPPPTAAPRTRRLLAPWTTWTSRPSLGCCSKTRHHALAGRAGCVDVGSRQGLVPLPIYPHLTVWPASRAPDLAGLWGLCRAGGTAAGGGSGGRAAGCALYVAGFPVWMLCGVGLGWILVGVLGWDLPALSLPPTPPPDCASNLPAPLTRVIRDAGITP